jgi:ABC-type polysaccharide/polyol phosphate export permease
MYFSAIFYPANIIPEKFGYLLLFNPVYHYISGFRQLVYIGGPPQSLNIVICLGISIVTFALGLLVFTKKENELILHV